MKKLLITLKIKHFISSCDFKKLKTQRRSRTMITGTMKSLIIKMRSELRREESF
jgi:hypothetical protein